MNTTYNKKKWIVILGMPLVGKSSVISTLKNILGEKVLVQSSGEILRKVQDPDFQHFLSLGGADAELNSKLLVTQALKCEKIIHDTFFSNIETIINDDSKNVLITDGFPRYPWQIDYIFKYSLEKIFDISVIFITATQERLNLNFNKRRISNPRDDDKQFKFRVESQKKHIKHIFNILRTRKLSTYTIVNNISTTMNDIEQKVIEYIGI